MRRLDLHQRVYVARDHANRPVEQWGRVVRLRRADDGAWIDLDERVEAACPFPPEGERGRHCRANPDGCELVGPAGEGPVLAGPALGREFQRWQDDGESIVKGLVDALIDRGWDFALVQIGRTVGVEAGQLRHAGAVSRRCTGRGAPTLPGQAAQLRSLADDFDREHAAIKARVAAERGEPVRETVVVVTDTRPPLAESDDESGGVH